MTFSSKAIVVSLKEFGEADRYVDFYTERWGIITALAKAARKSKRRYVGGLDFFCHDEILLRGEPRERPYLVELKVLNSFAGLREDLEKMLTAGQIIQWVRRLTFEASPMPRVYSLIGQTLSLIEGEGNIERLDLLALIFKVKLISYLGLKPRIDSCVKCGDTQGSLSVFDIGAGGMLCQKCLSGTLPDESQRLDAHDREFLAQMDRFRLTQWEEFDFPQRKVKPLSRLVTQFASYHNHVRLPH